MKIWKRIVAILLVFSIVLADSNLWSITAMAEGETAETEVGDTVKYQFKAYTAFENQEYTISRASYTILDSNGGSVEKNGNSYELIVGDAYECQVSSDRLKSEFITSFDAEASEPEGGTVVKAIQIPIDFLNVSMSDKRIERNSTVNMLASDDWRLNWTWESSDKNVATVDSSGMVTALNVGTTTITKTSNIEGLDSQIEVTATVTVVPKEVRRQVAFVISGTRAELQNLKTTICDTEGNIISPSSGIYTFLEGDTYEYEITDANGEEPKGINKNSLTGTFVVSGNSSRIEVPITVVMPSFNIGDVTQEGMGVSTDDITSNTKMKSGSSLSVDCVNDNDVYATYSNDGKPHWTYRINNQNAVELWTYSNPTSYSDGLTIDCLYNGIVVKTYRIGKFDSYGVEVNYDGVKLQGTQCTFKRYYNTVELADLQVAQRYNVTVTRTQGGFINDKYECEITPKPFEEIIQIAVPDGNMSKPSLSPADLKLYGFSGGSISLKDSNNNNIISINGTYYSDTNIRWNWECVKLDSNGDYDWNKTVPVTNNSIDLSNAEAGEYALIYSYKNLKSNPISVHVSDIAIDVDWDKWEGMERPYDATTEFEIEIPILSDAIGITDGNSNYIDKNNFYIEDEDKLVITGNVTGKDVGEYKVITVTGVSVSGAQNKYNLGIVNDLIGKTVKFETSANEEAKLKITKATVHVEEVTNPISLQFKSNRINYDGSKDSVSFSEDLKKANELKKDLFEAMGVATIISTNQCTFANVKYNETGSENEKAYIDNQNVIYYFSDGNYDTTNQRLVLNYSVSSELVQIDKIFQKITLTQIRDDKTTTTTQETVTLENENWCNEEAITATFANPEENEYYNSSAVNGYNKIAFKSLGIHSMTQLEGYYELHNGLVQGMTTNIALQNINQEEYYEIVFTKANTAGTGIDETFQFSSAAAVLRIIPEANVDEDAEYPIKVELSNGTTYPVITLFYDNSSGKVVFVENRLNRTNNNIYDTDMDMKEIAFTIENTGFDVNKVEYVVMDVEDQDWTQFFGTKWFDESDLDEVDRDYVDAPEPNADGIYTVKLRKDGEYIVFVRATNDVGDESEFISNAFMSDSVPPLVEVKFTSKGEDVTDQILSGEHCYFDTDQVDVEIKVSEKHLKDVAVTATMTDAEGQVIDDINDEIKQAIDSVLNGSQEENDSRDVYEFQYSLDKNANYSISVLATDTANNNGLIQDDSEEQVEEEVIPTFSFTIDDEDPTGMIALSGPLHTINKIKDGIIEMNEKGVLDTLANTWDEIRDFIQYNVFTTGEATYILYSADAISGHEAFYYVDYADSIDDESSLTVSQLEALKKSDWISCTNETHKSLEKNKKAAIYQKVVDRAGNTTYMNSEGVITDGKAPEIDVTAGEGNENGFYNKDIPLQIKVEDKPAKDAVAVSGIQYVGYRIESGDQTMTDSKTLYDGRKDKDPKNTTFEDNKQFIKAKDFNSNEVNLYVTAVDNSGNEDTKKYTYKIDRTAPTIDIKFDDQEGNDYYNDTRTATITIKERNLDTKDVDITIQSEHGSKAAIEDWVPADDAGKSDDAIHTCKVTFAADDDYVFYVDCKDKAGNVAETSEKHRFTIDRTKPIIEVSYSGEQIQEDGYYNSAISAIITITEHNFDASKADIQINGPEGSRIGASTFQSNGDKHTASVVFNQDGTYSLGVSFVDEAGNPADSYEGSSFNIDLKDPEVVISNVKDKSANKDDVKPIITCTDENYDENKVTITVRGSNTGEVSLEQLNLESKKVANGEEFYLTFPKNEAMDDVYTLTAEMEDKAGNETKDSIQFSVNRYGSVYTLGTETGEWLTDGVCSYIQEGRPVVIIETNVDEVVERNISYTTGSISAETVAVKELTDCTREEKTKGTYFESKKISSGSDWYQYQYTIAANNFIQEGNYSIQIDSKDKAGNHASNVSNKHSDSNLEILFAIDQTAPSAVVSGTENGGIYREEKRTVLLDVQDNLALGEVVVYLNGNEYATYDAKKLSELTDGFIPVEVGESFATQTIQLRAIDMAGNILGENVSGKYDKTFEDFNLIVTQNIFAQILHLYWMFILIGIVLIVGLVAFIIIRRKKRA